MSSSQIAPDQLTLRTRNTAHSPLSTGENSPVPLSAQGERVRLLSLASSINGACGNAYSPPTPSPSPQPTMADTNASDTNGTPGAQDPTAQAVAWSLLAPSHLPNLPSSSIDFLLTSTLPYLASAQLTRLASILPAHIKRDFLAELPPEIALYILSFVDDVTTLVRASRVSRAWRVLVNDEAPWKNLFARRGFELQDEEQYISAPPEVRLRSRRLSSASEPQPTPMASVIKFWPSLPHGDASPDRKQGSSRKGKERAKRPSQQYQTPLPLPFSYRKHFKKAHLTESNWRHSGRLLRSQRSHDAGVVTSLALDGQWIAVGLSDSRVHVFSASTGVLARTLIGHGAGVWSLWLVSKGGSSYPKSQYNDLNTTAPTLEELKPAPEPLGSDSWASMIPQSLRAGIGLGTTNSSASSFSSSSSSSSGDMPFQSVFDSLRPPPGESVNIPAEDNDPSACQSDPCNASRGWGQSNALVISAGCDKQIRVWDVKSGYCLYVLRGHRSTVRCIKMFHGRPVAVSGGRDHTLRVWDIQRGTLLRTLEGHTDSVRCLDVFGNQVVSGSYDCTVRLWDVDTGECLRVFNGHYHQVYTVAFDGERIASGGLDTTVRIWSASTGACLALLQGHTTLICQLQLSSRTNTVITGSADGRIIIFNIAPASVHVRSIPPRQGVSMVTPAEADVPASPPLSPPMLAVDHGTTHDAQRADTSGYRILARVPAHNSSVTGLQFDDRPGRRWVVSGGTDGRVLLWEFDDGVNGQPGGIEGGRTRGAEMKLVRDLTEPCEGLWKVAFRGDLAVICCLRSGRTVLEIWSFRPIEEDL